MATAAEAPELGALDARALFNPAFIALLLRRAAAGHQRDHHRPLPLMLAFLVPPLVLHGPTRRALPPLNTRLASWATRNPLLRAELAVRAPRLTPITRRALRFGVRHGLIEFEANGLSPGHTASPTGEPQTDDSAECLRAAELLGRWLPRTGSDVTVYALLGVRP